MPAFSSPYRGQEGCFTSVNLMGFIFGPPVHMRWWTKAGGQKELQELRVMVHVPHGGSDHVDVVNVFFSGRALFAFMQQGLSDGDLILVEGSLHTRGTHLDVSARYIQLAADISNGVRSEDYSEAWERLYGSDDAEA